MCLLLIMYFLDSRRQTLFAQSVHQIHEEEDLTIVYTNIFLIGKRAKGSLLIKPKKPRQCCS